MVLLNFSSLELTDRQKAQIISNTEEIPDIDAIHNISISERETIEINQLEDLLQRIPFDIDWWETDKLFALLPTSSLISAILIAKLHAWMGKFPKLIRSDNFTVFNLNKIYRKELRKCVVPES